MINEFFEITRYNTQQIKLSKKPVDLRYLLEDILHRIQLDFKWQHLRGEPNILPLLSQ